MDAFSDTEMIKLAALAGAFVIGVGVCTYVVIKESMELKQRRRAKKLMYQEAVQREVARQKAKQQMQGDENNYQSFA